MLIVNILKLPSLTKPLSAPVPTYMSNERSTEPDQPARNLSDKDGYSRQYLTTERPSQAVIQEAKASTHGIVRRRLSHDRLRQLWLSKVKLISN
ncbi:hypothetical protein ACT691_04620 [Vibrio metschnikovii]